MSSTGSNYASTCKLKNTNNEKIVEAEILEFKPSRSLTVSVNRSVKVILKYEDRNKIYVGNMAGMEFTSTGPTETIQYKGRNR